MKTMKMREVHALSAQINKEQRQQKQADQNANRR
jgi:hypothetical protein